jgi:beta-lactamase superfamily II metal-dependent hydrolase
MNPLTARRCGALLLLSLLLAASAAPAVTPNGKLQIIHLDVGQGDGAVLISPLGQVAMFDDGGSLYPVFPCAKVLTELGALGVTHVDYHFASHFHADHIGCFDSLSKTITFDQGWDGGSTYSNSMIVKYKAALGGHRHVVTKGRVFTLDSLSAHPVTIKVVDFNESSTTDENPKSVMLLVQYGSFSESFGGDQGYDGSPNYGYETEYGPEVDTVLVYKVHHHSSAYSSGDIWLNATAPKVGIISLGDANPYSFPTSATMTRLHNHNVQTYWTEQGTGVSPVAGRDKVAHGPITITATWQPAGKVYISGGTGAGAFRDSLVNPGTAVTAVDEPVAAAHPLRSLRNPAMATAQFAVGVVGGPVSDLAIFGVDGRRVRTVFNGVLEQGEQKLTWDGRDQAGRPAETGLYFARFVSRGRAESVKFMLFR